jgi:hypothetical protein
LGERAYQSFYNHLHECIRNSWENIKDFNDSFNTLVRFFPQELKPSKATILGTYISMMRDPYGVLIGQHPITLFKAQERDCEIKEKLVSSPLEEEECLKETLQINQIDDFASPNIPSNVKTYL